MRRTSAAVPAAGLLAAGLLAGCAVSSPLPPDARPLPVTSTTPSTAAPSPAPTNCGDVTASLRPPAALPAAGTMPAGSAMARIQRRGHLTVAVIADVPPFGTVNPFSGELEGFDVDVAAQVARAVFGSDGHLKLRTVTNAERIPVVLDGSVDMAVATMTVTCARRAQVDFSQVYFEATQRVLVTKGSPYTGLADLGGRKVCAAAGTTSIQRIADAPSHPVPYPATNVADCLVALQTGAVDAVATDDTILAGMAEQDPFTQVVGPRGAAEPYGIAVDPKNQDLTRFVNGVLTRIESDGTWAGIYRRWLGALGAPPAPPRPAYRG